MARFGSRVQPKTLEGVIIAALAFDALRSSWLCEIESPKGVNTCFFGFRNSETRQFPFAMLNRKPGQQSSFLCVKRITHNFIVYASTFLLLFENSKITFLHAPAVSQISSATPARRPAIRSADSRSAKLYDLRHRIHSASRGTKSWRWPRRAAALL